jgi:hypothetical protein
MRPSCPTRDGVLSNPENEMYLYLESLGYTCSTQQAQDATSQTSNLLLHASDIASTLPYQPLPGEQVT